MLDICFKILKGKKKRIDEALRKSLLTVESGQQVNGSSLYDFLDLCVCLKTFIIQNSCFATWANHLTSLCFGFPYSKAEIMRVPSLYKMYLMD